MKIEERIAVFVKKEKRQPKAWEVCPRADSCNINKCPLHQDFLRLVNDSSDFAIVHKQKCLPKRLRREIGTYFKLSNLGLKQREFSSAKKWDSLSPEQREVEKQKLMKNSPFISLKSKGYAITRVKENKAGFTRLNGKTSSKNDIQQILVGVESQ
jgi:hypothetical protein